MRWALKRRTIRPLIPVCLMAIILIFISFSSVLSQTSRSFDRLKDLPKIFPDPDIECAEPGESPWGFDYVASSYPYDPNRKNETEDVVIKQLKSPLNYYRWLLKYFPLLKQAVLEF